MARPKKKQEQPDLATRPVAAEPSAAPAVPAPAKLEYTPVAQVEKWQAQRFDLLAAQFELGTQRTVAEWQRCMEDFHEFCVTQAQPSTWFFVRRLFGVQPLILPETAHPDDFWVHSREELSKSQSLPVEQIDADLAFLKTGWSDFIKQATGAAAEIHEQKSQALEKSGGELELDDALLVRYGFHESFFKAMVWDAFAEIKNAENVVVATGMETKRSEAENKAERDWFVAKLRTSEWQKMLDEGMTAELARETLLNEMTLRRLQREMAPLSQGSTKYKELSNIRTTVMTAYRGQLDELQKKFPELGVAGKVTYRQVISDLNLAHRQYYGKKDNRLWDKMFTAGEIQFLLRQSVQQPSARYRLGWTVACVEAMNGLYNPDFRSQLKKSDLAKLDAGFKMGVETARKNNGEPLVNLERGVLPGEGDEFPEYGPDPDSKKKEAVA